VVEIRCQIEEKARGSGGWISKGDKWGEVDINPFPSYLFLTTVLQGGGHRLRIVKSSGMR
jgi:hypothetical protein